MNKMLPFLSKIFFILSFIAIVSNGHTIEDSTKSNENTSNDSLRIQASQDSLNAMNQETIEHISKIFSNFKDKRPKIGIVLAGGGAKGFAHVGVLQLLDSLNIPIDYIAGNSMGGLVGGLYSIGYSGNDLENFAQDLDWNYLLNDNPPREELPFIEKKKSGKYQLRIGLDGYKPAIPAGLIYGQNIQMFFLNLTAPYEGIESFDDLPIPYRCVAVDLISGKQVVLKNGSLAKAMRATMSIPSAFSPVDWDEYLLVDGLVLNNFPADVVKEMGADIIIGLNLSTGEKKKEDLSNFLTILERTTDIPMGAKLEQNIEMSDIYISQDLRGFGTTDFSSEKVLQIIGRGKEAGENNRDVLIALKNELEKYEQYKEYEKKGRDEIKNKIKATRDNYKSSPPIINSYVIQGNVKFSDVFIEHHLELNVGETWNNETLANKIEALYSLDYFENITYEVHRKNESEIDLVVNVKEKRLNRLVAGFKYNNYFKLVGLVGLETNSVVIAGGQLEAYLRFGGLTTLDVTLLYPSRSMDMAVYPFFSAHYKDIPMDFYFEGKKIFQFNNESWRLDGGLNFSLSKFWNLEGSIEWEYMNASTEIATPEIDEILSRFNLEATLVTGKIRLLYDSVDDINIPNSGVFFNSYFESTLPSFGSDLTYNRFFVRFDTFIPIAKQHNLRFDGAYMLAWNKKQVPFYKWFFIGGPKTFVGIDYFQANGTEFTIASASYRYEVFESIYLRGVFNTMFNYNLLDGDKSDKVLYGWGISGVMKSMLGRIELMWSRGDKYVSNPGEKSNKVYFRFGFNL